MVQYVLQLFKQRIAELTNKSIVSEMNLIKLEL